MSTHLLGRRTLLGGLAALPAIPALAQGGYPTRPIRLLVPHEAGSSVDNMARRLSPPMSAALGQPVVVNNVTGSGGVIGLTQLARSPRDGYTIGMVANNLAIVPSLYRLPYDPIGDIQPITITVSGPMVLVVHPSLPARSMEEFLALARTRSGNASLTMGSAGAGTVGHLAYELMAIAAGIEMLHVPYRGNNVFTTDLVGGQINAGFIAVGTALPLIRANSVRALGLTSATRVSSLPDVPTFAESGMRGYELSGWQALIAPAGIPRPILDELNARTAEALQTPDVDRIVTEEGRQIVGNSIEEATEVVTRDIRRFAEVTQRIGLRPQN